MNKIKPGDIVVITHNTLPRLGVVLKVHKREDPTKDIARVHLAKNNKAYNFLISDMEKIIDKNT